MLCRVTCETVIHVKPFKHLCVFIIMPQLVRGHMLFTDADYVVDDFQEIAAKRNRRKSSQTLAKILRKKTERFLLAQQAQAQLTHAEQAQAEPTVAARLTDMLAVLSALVTKEGYNLTDLMKNI
jgi:hypothetical protein